MNKSSLISDAESCLENIKAKPCTLAELQERSVHLASLMLQEGGRTQKPEEKARQQQMAEMIADPVGKTFTSAMADQCFRAPNSARSADQFVFLLNKFGIPNYLSPFKRLQMKLFQLLGKPLSAFTVPAMTYAMRKETESVIIPGEEKKLSGHLKARHAQGVRMNLNHLGEAILGEEEALSRLQVYLEDLANPDIEYISIKISTIFSQINLLAWEDTLDILAERLRKLYRAAQKNTHARPDGSKVQKFVNLDMEEYRDLHLTADLFKKVLDEEEFKHFSAGIVLQAYLPDSFEIQKELTAWALKRAKSGGAPIKIRIVKGANLAMEKVEASLRGWAQAPYSEKIDVDANYKRMLLFGCTKEHARAVHLGIGSHNLFDIAFGMLLRAHHGIEAEVCFEMLEGMAVHLSRVVKQLSGDMLLYCPSAKKHEFQNAVAYLIRRLDENTASDNFLRHAFQLEEKSPSWNQQVELFKRAFDQIPKALSSARRQQNRLEEPEMPPLNSPFQNEADTDFALENNRIWAHAVVSSWQDRKHPPIPVVIGGKEILFTEDRRADEGKGTDPSHPDKKLYSYTMAGLDHVEAALKTAEEALPEWSATPLEKRSEILARAAHIMRKERGTLIGAMMADGGKTFAEADVEVSETIDMAEYYRRCREELEGHHDLSWSPKGITVVVPPWNFPCAIPAGGILAALMAGNSVIFKPSRETVLIAWHLANTLWQAGVPRNVLQFITGSSAVIGDRLIGDPRVKAVILTGSTATAKQMLKVRPDLHLMAETGGKNSIIVTNLSDKDLAIKDAVHSAFGHAGQKCSACSLLILEKDVYDDPSFQKQLRDAAASLHVGTPWDLSTKVNPLIHAPEKELSRGLTTLEVGETWLLEPKRDRHNPNLWTPGIKWGVKEGSFMHLTELFGPVLGVMCASNLEHAIRLANGTRYGLTTGLHSLDEREHEIWLKKIEAGNLYINRGITGAIVRRQPFGGYKESSFGPGPKAGGPNYVAALMHAKQITAPADSAAIDPALQPLEKTLSTEDLPAYKRSAQSYAFWAKKYSQDEDPSQILGQDNFLRYLPQTGIVLRIQPQDSPLAIAQVCAAAVTCKSPLQISCTENLKDWPALPGIEIVRETEEQLLARMHKIKRLRTLSKPSDAIVKAAAENSCYVCTAAPLQNGRIELLNALREVSISIDYHRYGNLGERETNKK